MRQSELPNQQAQQQAGVMDSYAAETQYRNLLLSGRKKVDCRVLFCFIVCYCLQVLCKFIMQICSDGDDIVLSYSSIYKPRGLNKMLECNSLFV